MPRARQTSSRAEFSWDRYRRRFLAALVLLVWADLVVSRTAAEVYGLGAEVNPLMRWLLAQEPWLVLGINLAVFFFALVGFREIVRIGASLTDEWAERFHRLCGFWINAMVVVGAIVVLNNCAVTILGAVY